MRRLIFEKEERETFYRKLIELNHKLQIDIFKPYFELYAAERKTNQQDYTPDSVATIMSVITREDKSNRTGKYTAYDMTAGTGSLLISKWWDDMIQETPFSYAPHRYFYYGEEKADNAIPYLIHNLAMRGMNAIITHGDSLHREIKQIYFLQNSKDDFLGFSDVNVMPHSKAVQSEFDVKKWLEEEIVHIESQEVVIQPALPMKAKKIKENERPINFISRPKWLDAPKLKELAFVERARKGKIYPKGSIIIQISATRGQFGMLECDGHVPEKYGVIVFRWDKVPNSEYGFYLLHKVIPRWIEKRKQGLNITIQDIEEMPFTTDFSTEKISIDSDGQILLDV